MKHTHKLFSLLLCLTMLLMPMSLVACGSSDNKDKENTKGGGVTLPNADRSYDDSLITELYAEEGSFTDKWGNAYTYSIHVPQVTAQSADAKALNEEIKATFEGQVEALKECIRQQFSLEISGVRWESQWTGSLLTLVIISEQPDMSSLYDVYHFDFASETRLTGSQVLARLNINAEDFMTATRRAAAQTYDSMYAGVATELDGEAAGYLAPLRALTIGSIGRDADNVAFRPESDGTLTAYLPIGSVAGAGWYNYPVVVAIPVEPKEEPGFPPGETENGQVRAAIISENRGIEVFCGDTGKYYVVQGCYSDYTKLIAAGMGPGGLDYVFALTSKGNVEMINVSDGRDFEVLCSSGPLYGLSDIVDFQKGTREDEYGQYDTVFALSSEGGQYDLMEYIRVLDNAMTDSVIGTWEAKVQQAGGAEAGGTESAFILTTDEYHESTLYEKVPGQDSYVAYHGALAVLGMGDGGLVCGYFFTGPDGNDLLGAWSVIPDYGSLKISALSGEDIFAAFEDVVEFEKSME